MKRYAIYYAPPPGPLARFGAEWLGWDPETGTRLARPAAVDAVVAAPRKYGLHGTLMAPFRPNCSRADLEVAVDDLARRLHPVWPGNLNVTRLGQFLALVPRGDQTELRDMAAQIVTFLDPFRAPLTEAEVARRKPEQLPPQQRDLLDRWGYPYVMEEFRFHITLTGPCGMAPEEIEPQINPVLPDPFGIEEICLFGEDDDGYFHLLRRYPI